MRRNIHKRIKHLSFAENVKKIFLILLTLVIGLYFILFFMQYFGGLRTLAFREGDLLTFGVIFGIGYVVTYIFKKLILIEATE